MVACVVITALLGFLARTSAGSAAEPHGKGALRHAHDPLGADGGALAAGVAGRWVPIGIARATSLPFTIEVTARGAARTVRFHGVEYSTSGPVRLHSHREGRAVEATLRLDQGEEGSGSGALDNAFLAGEVSHTCNLSPHVHTTLHTPTATKLLAGQANSRRRRGHRDH